MKLTLSQDEVMEIVAKHVANNLFKPTKNGDLFDVEISSYSKRDFCTVEITKEEPSGKIPDGPERAPQVPELQVLRGGDEPPESTAAELM